MQCLTCQPCGIKIVNIEKVRSKHGGILAIKGRFCSRLLYGQLEKQGTGNGTGTGTGTGTGNQNLREAAGVETTRNSRLSSHESQGRVGLRTHSSLILLTSRASKNWGKGRVQRSTRSSSE